MDPDIQSAIESSVQFSVGELPVRYLGVPLISTRLNHSHCLPLIEKVKGKILNWKNKSLSFAGRLQLISSVLNSLQVFWSSVFILPVSVSKEIEKIMRGFLWCHGEMKRGKAKVKWKDVCRPMKHGGLGLKLLRTWNQALISKHTWNIVARKDSLWVRWIHMYRLHNSNFWEFKGKTDTSWGWKKILEFRDTLRSHIIHKIGNGENTSAWFDNWHPLGPLDNLLTHRNMCVEELDRHSVVADLRDNDGWKWPLEWQERFPDIFFSHPGDFDPGTTDKVMWKTNAGNLIDFSVGDVWMDIREEGGPVPWFKLVWFSQNIPRHAFILWLAILQKLKTHDVMGNWMDITTLRCVFCKLTHDSHEHLFFACPYSMAIWKEIGQKTKWGSIPNGWTSIIRHLSNLRNNRSIWSIINRLTIGAAVYFVWQERNLRIHEERSRPEAVILKLIDDTVRLRLLGLQMVKSAATLEAAQVWNLHNIQWLITDNTPTYSS